MLLHITICWPENMEHSVLLLGGNGFIGQALARKYVELGHTVHIISRRKSDFNHSSIHSHQASLDNLHILDELIPQCELIIHTASTCTPGSSAANPTKEGEDNLLPLLRLLEILQKYSPRHFAFISSGGTVYGETPDLPAREDSPLKPISYHGASKVAAEMFVQALARSGYPTTILRPSNVYGPGQNGPMGFGIVRTVLQHLKSGTPMEIWGDGKTLRDYLYIDDLVDAIIQVQQHNCLGTFNVGTGMGYSVNEVIALAESIAGDALKIISKPARSVDVKGIVLDCSKLNKSTGWLPRLNLEAGIRKTWAWLSEQ